MYSRFTAITFTLMMIITSTGFTQGDYLSRGESGFGVSGGFSTNSDATTLGGDVSYSVNGVADFGLSFLRTSFDVELLGEDLRVTAIIPSAIFYLLKQDSIRMPISASISFAYEKATFSSKALDLLDWDMSGSFLGFGLSFFRNIRVEPTSVIQPRISLGYWTGKIRVEDSFGNHVDEDNNTTALRLGLSAFLESSHKTSILGIHPGISFTDDNTTFSLGLGYIFKSP